MKQWALYELHRSGSLWYIGITANPKRRLAHHRSGYLSDKPTMTVLRWYDSRREAHTDELRRIYAERPPGNQDWVRSMAFMYGKDFIPSLLREPKRQMRKLTAEQMIEIRKRRKAGASVRELAEEFGVSDGTIRAYSVDRER
jgi:hypothetical protein